jgi:hypothetical protein
MLLREVFEMNLRKKQQKKQQQHTTYEFTICSLGDLQTLKINQYS